MDCFGYVACSWGLSLDIKNFQSQGKGHIFGMDMELFRYNGSRLFRSLLLEEFKHTWSLSSVGNTLSHLCFVGLTEFPKCEY